MLAMAGLSATAGGHFIVPERQVAPDYAIGPAAGIQCDLALVWGPQQYFVVWTDGRDASFGMHAVAWATDIFAGRVTADGQVLDPSGLPINYSYSLQDSPAVAWNGTHYLVVWTDLSAGWNEEDLYMTLVTANGQSLWPDGVPLCNHSGASTDAAVGWDGTNFLAVWQDSRNGDDLDIYAARVAPDGTVLDPNGFPVCQAPDNQMNVALAWNGSHYLIVWSSGRWGTDIYGALYDPAGVGSPVEFPICQAGGLQDHPAVTWDGANFLVAWHDQRSGQADIYAAHVTPLGLVLEPDGFPVVASETRELYPAVACAGGSCLIAYQLRDDHDSPDVMGALLNPGGLVTVFPISAHAGDEQLPALYSNGTSYLCAWDDTRQSERDVFAARITAEGLVHDPGGFRVSWAAEHRQWPAAAFDGNQYLVAWTENNPEADAVCARVDRNGVSIDTTAIVLSGLPTWERFPEIASTPAGWFVVWQDERNYDASGSDFYAAWVDFGGIVYPGPGGMPLYTGPDDQERPAIAWDGGTLFLVVYQQPIYGVGDDVWGLIYHADTGLITGPFPICQQERIQSQPRPAFDGTAFMVVWEDERRTIPLQYAQSDIYAARVTTDGVVLDPDGFEIAAEEAMEYSPRISWNGTSYLVAYQRTPEGAAPDIYGVWLNPDGLASSPFPIAADPDLAEWKPDVSWDGTAHAVSFQGWPSRLCVATLVPGASGPPPVDCFEPGHLGRNPVACHGPRRRHLLLYESRWLEPPYGSYRLMTRQFLPFPIGDMNCDGKVGFADINAFVMAITNPLAYQASYPNCDLMNGDVNEDGSFGFADINPFVRLLTGG